MKLTNEQIRSITFGAACTEETERGIALYRFTPEERAYYKTVSEDFYMKAHSSAGIRLEFTTNSRRLSFGARMTPGSSRPFCHFDLYRDGIFFVQVGADGTDTTVSAELDLGEGEKEIKLYCPWSASTELTRVILDDGATLTPAVKSRTMLIYGDSITQGYDTRHPSLSYASLLTDALDAEGVNKAIGGEVFRPGLADLGAGDPDLITVAYGTNDWSHRPLEEFETGCEGFYRALSEKYPRATIFAITPIWRRDLDRVTPVGAFDHVREHIERVAASLPNVRVLYGFDCVPKDPGCFAPDCLHPNDEGFIHYFKGIYEQIKAFL